MNIIIFLLVGLLVGWIASTLVEGHGLGTLGDIIVGIIGAFVGGFVSNVLGVVPYGPWGSLAMSVVGAIIFLSIIGMFTGLQRSRKPLVRL